jgi:hypothetical protein
MMKFELVITVWDEDGIFKLRDRIVASDEDSLKEQFDVTMGIIENRLAESSKNKYMVGDDDDIPF